MEDAFDSIFKKKYWSSVHANGPGSTEYASKDARHILTEVIEKYNIRSLVDAPCGLYSWIGLTNTAVDYIGIDIVKEQIDQNSLNHKDKLFLHKNLAEGYPAEATNKDLIFCRHLTQHLSSETTLKVLNHFKESGCKYLLITNYKNINKNSEVCEWKSSNCPELDKGAYRPQNLLLPPYSFGSLIEEFQEFALFQLK
jgi:hypothetical protein